MQCCMLPSRTRPCCLLCYQQEGGSAVARQQADAPSPLEAAGAHAAAALPPLDHPDPAESSQDEGIIKKDADRRVQEFLVYHVCQASMRKSWSVTPQMPLATAEKVMDSRGVDHLPVVSEHTNCQSRGLLIGFVGREHITIVRRIVQVYIWDQKRREVARKERRDDTEALGILQVSMTSDVLEAAVASGPNSSSHLS